MTPTDPFLAVRRRMVETQLRPRGIASRKVLDLMAVMPRHLFVSEELRESAYTDEALPSVEGQTISQPFMVAVMTQELQLAPAHRVLELGTGTGYQTAILARLVPEGTVHTIECVPALSDFAQRKLKLMGIENVRYFVGDGTLGWPATEWHGAGPVEFDRILITAGAPDVPRPLALQLREGGVMVVPIGARNLQTLVRVEKRDGRLVETRLLACRFVPLLGDYGWAAT